MELLLPLILPSYVIEGNDLTDFRFSTINLATLAVESNFTIAPVCDIKQRCYLYAAATSLSGNALVGASHHGGTASFYSTNQAFGS